MRPAGTAAAVAVTSGLAFLAGRASRRRMAALRSQAAVQRERERYARLLHDRVLQTLETLSVCAELSNTPLGDHLADEVTWLHELIDHGVPTAGGDLVTALRQVAGRRRPLPVAIGLHVRDSPVLPPEVVEALSGAADEAVTNAAKHARGAAVEIVLAMRAGTVVLQVLDRGPGLPAAGGVPGFGTQQSITARMRAVGGDGRVLGAPGGGTLVELVYPSDPVSRHEPGSRPAARNASSTSGSSSAPAWRK